MPLLIGFALIGWSAAAGLFALAWVLAYPASYYLGRAVVIEVRKASDVAHVLKVAGIKMSIS